MNKTGKNLGLTAVLITSCALSSGQNEILPASQDVKPANDITDSTYEAVKGVIITDDNTCSWGKLVELSRPEYSDSVLSGCTLIIPIK